MRCIWRSGQGRWIREVTLNDTHFSLEDDLFLSRGATTSDRLGLQSQG